MALNETPAFVELIERKVSWHAEIINAKTTIHKSTFYIRSIERHKDRLAYEFEGRRLHVVAEDGETQPSVLLIDYIKSRNNRRLIAEHQAMWPFDTKVFINNRFVNFKEKRLKSKFSYYQKVV